MNCLRTCRPALAGTLAVLFASVISACADSNPVASTSPDAKVLYAKTSAPGGVVLTQLPTLGGTSSSALAINDGGTIVGYSTDANGVGFATRWVLQKNGSWNIARLGTGVATAINSGGTVLGYRGDQILVWENGSEFAVGTGYLSDRRGGINFSGTVAGNGGATSSAVPAAWVRSSNSWTRYTLPLGTYTQADVATINDAGVIVGYAHDGNKKQWAVRWTPDPDLSNTWILSTIDAGAGDYYALDLNGAGDIVGGGHTEVNGGNMAYLWAASGQRTGLGSLGGCCSWAEGVSASDEIVGSATNSRGNWYGFYWQAGTMTTLAPPNGYASTEARDINSLKQVVGLGTTARGRTSAFLWQLP